MGRTIQIKTSGRYATAWDVESATTVKVNHFGDSKDAAKEAVQKLISELEQKGIIKKAPSIGKMDSFSHP